MQNYTILFYTWNRSMWTVSCYSATEESITALLTRWGYEGSKEVVIISITATNSNYSLLKIT